MRFGSEVYRFIFAAKNRTEAVDRSFRDSLGTFRRMTRAGDRARRSRCGSRSSTVKRGDTVEKLARRMAVGRPARSSASACSTGSATKDRLKPGDLVKIVVE